MIMTYSKDLLYIDTPRCNKMANVECNFSSLAFESDHSSLVFCKLVPVENVVVCGEGIAKIVHEPPTPLTSIQVIWFSDNACIKGKAAAADDAGFIDATEVCFSDGAAAVDADRFDDVGSTGNVGIGKVNNAYAYACVACSSFLCLEGMNDETLNSLSTLCFPG